MCFELTNRHLNAKLEEQFAESLSLPEFAQARPPQECIRPWIQQ